MIASHTSRCRMIEQIEDFALFIGRKPATRIRDGDRNLTGLFHRAQFDPPSGYGEVECPFQARLQTLFHADAISEDHGEFARDDRDKLNFVIAKTILDSLLYFLN